MSRRDVQVAQRALGLRLSQGAVARPTSRWDLKASAQHLGRLGRALESSFCRRGGMMGCGDLHSALEWYGLRASNTRAGRRPQADRSDLLPDSATGVALHGGVSDEAASRRRPVYRPAVPGAGTDTFGGGLARPPGDGCLRDEPAGAGAAVDTTGHDGPLPKHGFPAPSHLLAVIGDHDRNR